jgi:protease PrsW
MRKLLLLSATLLAALPVMATDSYAAWVAYSQTIMSVTILLFILVVGGMALWHTYKHGYRGKFPFWKYAIRNRLVQLGLAVALVVVLVNAMMPEPKTQNAHAAAEFAQYRQISKMAEMAYLDLTERYPFIVNYHFEYIAAHYATEAWADKKGEMTVSTDAESPVMKYTKLRFERNPYLRDLGRLGLGMSEFYEYSFDIAMNQFRAIETKYMPYRNLFMGRIFLNQGNPDSAEYHFRREIAIGEVQELATAALAAQFYAHEPDDSLGKLMTLVGDPELGRFVPTLYKRYAYTKLSYLTRYLGAVLTDWWMQIQWIGLLGAILGTVVWVLFLRRIDTTGRSAWLPIVFTFLGGAIFSFMALILYDFVRWELGFHLSADGNVGLDLLYCVFGIGFIEELVKIIPFLLLLQFTSRVQSPLSYIVYASVSALGFAFVENLMYFDAGHIGIMHGRVLICNVFHMFATSTIAFGMMLGRYRFGKLQWPFFFLFFVLAALMHGLYDFWLINETVSLLALTAYGLFIYATFQYAAYLNNALNQTPITRGRSMLDANGLAVYLTVGLVTVLVFEYLGLSLVYGTGIGNFALSSALGMGSFLMFFVVLNLSNIDLVQGEWIWIRLWNFGTRIAYNRAIGQRLRLIPKLQQGLLATLLPAAGEVVARISLNGDNRYFLFQFDTAPLVNGLPMEYVLLRAKQDGEIPESGRRIEAIVLAFRNKQALLRERKRKDDFLLLDPVLLE